MPKYQDAVPDIEDFKDYLCDIQAQGESAASRNFTYAKKFLVYLQEQGSVLPELTEKDIRTYIEQQKMTVHVEADFIHAMRHYCSFQVMLEKLDKNLFELIDTPREPAKIHTFYTQAEIQRLLAMPDTKTLRGLRDRAVLQLLYDTGMRNTELRRLQISDIDLLRKTICIMGKGEKQRLLPLLDSSVHWLTLWMERRHESLQDQVTSLLFPSRKTGVMMSSNGLWFMVKNYAKAAGLDNDFTVHSIRHAFASHMLENGAHLRAVQVLLGHSSLDSTQIYTQLSKNWLKRLHRKFHPRGG